MDAITQDMMRSLDATAMDEQAQERPSPHMEIAQNIAAALVDQEGWPDNLGTLMYAGLLWAFARLKTEQGVMKYIEPQRQPEMAIYERFHRIPADLPMRCNIAVHGEFYKASLEADRELVGFIRQRQRAYTVLDINH